MTKYFLIALLLAATVGFANAQSSERTTGPRNYKNQQAYRDMLYSGVPRVPTEPRERVASPVFKNNSRDYYHENGSQRATEPRKRMPSPKVKNQRPWRD